MNSSTLSDPTRPNQLFKSTKPLIAIRMNSHRTTNQTLLNISKSVTNQKLFMEINDSDLKTLKQRLMTAYFTFSNPKLLLMQSIWSDKNRLIRWSKKLSKFKLKSILDDNLGIIQNCHLTKLKRTKLSITKFRRWLT